MSLSPKIELNESALKHLFGKEILKRISEAIVAVYPDFDKKHFLALMPKLASLEMKPRVHLLRDELFYQLPKNFPKALKILLKSMKGAGLSGFELWPYSEFVQTYGLNDLEISLKALKEITKFFTSEWAIRPFIKKYPKETMEFLLECAGNKNTQVRRWACEGTRPRLPWGERLQSFVKDPAPTRTILEKLKFDSELFVRKSVANHLNDIAKDHPELVIKILTEWQKKAIGEQTQKIDWIIHRALRTLIKEGHAGALKLIGVSQKVQIELFNFKIDSKKIKLGERLKFDFEVRSYSENAQKLVVDYVVHFVKANKTTVEKVFKLKTIELPGKAVLAISKSHHFKKITTRTYYSGIHSLEIQINGIRVSKHTWHLEA